MSAHMWSPDNPCPCGRSDCPATPADVSARPSEWPMGETRNGYPIKICTCAKGPYIGTRFSGTPDCCERCGYMTPDQWTYIADHFDSEATLHLAEAEQRGAERVLAAVEALAWSYHSHSNVSVVGKTYRNVASDLRALVAQQRDGGGSDD